MNRRFRLIAALGMAVVLATFMLYVGIKGGDVQEPLLQAQELVSKRELATSKTVQVDGIAAGPMTGEQGEHFTFHITDRDGKHKTKIDYRGSVPDAFRIGRNVIVTGKLVADPKTGEVSHKPWSADELARFTRLVQDAVGYDASRGDSVSVINAPFAPEQNLEIASPPFYSQPWFWDIVKQVLGIVFILVLVFGVLRPVLNNLAGNKSKALVAGAGGDMALGEMGGLEGELAEDRVSLGGPPSILLPSPSEGYDAQLNAIKSLVAQDPGRVAQVVKDWINSDE